MPENADQYIKRVSSPKPGGSGYTVYGGMVNSDEKGTGFQDSSVMIADDKGKSATYYIGDSLPNGAAVQDIERGNNGVRVSVIYPDGAEEWLGPAGRKKAPASDTYDETEGEGLSLAQEEKTLQEGEARLARLKKGTSQGPGVVKL